jgi:lysophospholipase L1-like esterase
MKKPILLCIALLVGAFVSGCTDSAPSGPTPGLGGISVKKYVSIGNSLTAGYQSNGLYASAQIYSYPNMIAQQLVKSGAVLDIFQQPLYSDPGIPDPATGKAQRYEIISFADPNNPVIGPKGLPPGAPTNSALARPYDNLGIPGIPLAGFMDTTGTYQSPPLGRDAILRWTTNAALGKSVCRQISLLKLMGLTPDIVTFWLGANDVLGFATYGGVFPATGNAPTPAATFGFLYKQALDTLRKILPNAKIVVATIPDVRAIPFFNTVGPKIAASLKAEAALLGVPALYLRYQKHGNSSLAFDSTIFTESNPPMITLKAGVYAPYIGLPSGKWYKDNAYATLPAGIDTTKPFGLHPQNPIPDALVLDASEQTTAVNAINAYNSSIIGVAALDNAAVFDAYSFFNSVKANGYSIAGETYTADYISGGLFSLDGVHPSSRGYAIVANQYIKTLNSSYGMSIPYVDISTIPGIPMPLGKYAAGSKIVPSISLEAWKSFDALWGSGF